MTFRLKKELKKNQQNQLRQIIKDARNQKPNQKQTTNRGKPIIPK